MSQMHDEDDGSANVAGTALKVAGIALVLGLVIGVGTLLLVRSLGLNSPRQPGPAAVKSTSTSPAQPLPSTALPTPKTSTPGTGLSTGPNPTPSSGNGIQLALSPAFARPMQRVNLTGSYPGKDNMSLQVQRKEGGAWTSFPTSAQVQNGTFQTYVLTGRLGDQVFRVFDPQTNTASNPVTVTIK
ncbi:MAG: hypothetical protein M3Z50_10840 [Actinomycetota bacterium]|nr:hypothetical protein [Actinomycetota bacterium]